MKDEAGTRLVQILKDGTPVTEEKAAGALQKLAVNADNKVQLMKDGAGPVLVQLLKNGTPAAKENAAGALKNMQLRP